jgi:hypothetical protein
MDFVKRAFLTCLCTAIFPWALSANQSWLNPAGKSEARPQSQSAKTEVHFETTGLGEMRDEDGTHLPFTAYRASDGIKLTAIHGAFHSPLDAINYFDKQIGKATKIISRGETKDKSGKVIAERAEVILPVKTGASESVSAVLWTSGVNFHEIVSESQEDNLQLERKIPN